MEEGGVKANQFTIDSPGRSHGQTVHATQILNFGDFDERKCFKVIVTHEENRRSSLTDEVNGVPTHNETMFRLGYFR